MHCDEYVKLCDYADTTPRDNIHTIKRQIDLKFIAGYNVYCVIMSIVHCVFIMF